MSNGKIAVVSGAAGFIGSHLCDRLVDEYSLVIGVDDLSLGCRGNLNISLEKKNFLFLEEKIEDFGLLDLEQMMSKQSKIDLWHFAANSDILAGSMDLNVDLARTFLTTVSLISALQKYKIDKVIFASTSAVYGERPGEFSREDSGGLFPISNYGAMKLSSEAFLSAQAERLGFQLLCFRFPNVVGPRATHGILFDFFKKLEKNASELEVLGNGSQTKQYLLVEELLAAIELIVRTCTSRREVVNIGPRDSYTSVRTIAELFVSNVSPKTKLIFGQSDRGWVGDVPHFRLNIEKVLNAGWRPMRTSNEAVESAIRQIARERGISLGEPSA